MLHCTSGYPTPYNQVRLSVVTQLKEKFPDTVIGLSDHSIGNYTCYASIPLGASILEKHFTSDKNWSGPDIPISINPSELTELVSGSNAIFNSLGGEKTILDDEKITARFAYASIVTIREIKKGEQFSLENIWVKRPGTGQIRPIDFEKIINKTASCDIKNNKQLTWDMIE